MKFKVRFYNQYSIIPENCRTVSEMQIEAKDASDALETGAGLAKQYNEVATDESKIVHMVATRGTIIRAIY